MTSEASSAGVLLDSDYIIALSIVAESTHRKAQAIREKIVDIPQFILRSTTYELATVLSRKFNHALACAIVEYIEGSEITLLNMDQIEPAIWREFRSHQKKSTSFFDCANLVAARHYDLKIASFDTFYPKEFRA